MATSSDINELANKIAEAIEKAMNPIFSDFKDCEKSILESNSSLKNYFDNLNNNRKRKDKDVDYSKYKKELDKLLAEARDARIKADEEAAEAKEAATKAEKTGLEVDKELAKAKAAAADIAKENARNLSRKAIKKRRTQERTNNTNEMLKGTGFGVKNRFGDRMTVESTQAESVKKSARGIYDFGQVLSKQGGYIGKFGNKIKSFGIGLTKFSKFLGIAPQASKLLSKGLLAVSEANLRQQEIQNKRNTLLTERNVALESIDTETTLSKINTLTENTMSMYTMQFAELNKDVQITAQKAVASTQTKIGAAIGNANEAAWSALASQTDINAMEKKLTNEVSKTTATETRAMAARNVKLVGTIVENTWTKEQEILKSNEEMTALDLEAAKNAAENPWSETANRVAGGRTEADNVFGSGDYTKLKSRDGNVNTPSVEAHAFGGMVNSLSQAVGLNYGQQNYQQALMNKLQADSSEYYTNEKNRLTYESTHAKNIIKMTNTVIDSSNKIQDVIISGETQIKNSIIDTMTNIEKAYQKMSQTVENFYMNFQDMAYESGINKGITNRGQLDTYRQFMNSKYSHLAKTYGLTEDEFFKMQSGYTAEGRSKLLSREDFDEQAAFSKIYLGGDFGTASELSNNTEVFNMGVSDTVNLMGEMSKQVTKIGLDGRKYLKDVTKYLKQAQKYTFKDGVNGMLNMAKWAQKVRFNMDSIPAMLDNIQSGGLENIITKGAKLQVLGGRFAMGADPIAMAYEAYNDPEALAKRFNSMTQGMGRFNNKTGEVTFNGLEKDQLRLLAEYTNQDVTDVMNQARYHIKKDRIDKSLISNGLTEEQKEALISKAYIKDGKWKVTDVTGQERDISEFNKENIKDVQADTYEGKMSQGMSEIVSFTKLFTGDEKAKMAQFSEALQKSGVADEELKKRLAITYENFEETFQENLDNITTNLEKATEAYSNFLNQFKDNDNPFSEVNTNLQNINDDLNAGIDAILRSSGSTGVEAANKLKQSRELKGKSLKVGANNTEVSASELIYMDMLTKDKNGNIIIDEDKLFKKYGGFGVGDFDFKYKGQKENENNLKYAERYIKNKFNIGYAEKDKDGNIKYYGDKFNPVSGITTHVDVTDEVKKLVENIMPYDPKRDYLNIKYYMPNDRPIPMNNTNYNNNAGTVNDSPINKNSALTIGGTVTVNIPGIGMQSLNTDSLLIRNILTGLYSSSVMSINGKPTWESGQPLRLKS